MAEQYQRLALIFSLILFLFVPQKINAFEHQLNVTAYVPLSPLWEREIAKNTHIAVCRTTKNQQLPWVEYHSTQRVMSVVKTNSRRQELDCTKTNRTHSLTLSKNDMIMIQIKSVGFPKVVLPAQTIELRINEELYVSSTSAHFVAFQFKPKTKGLYNLKFINKTYEKSFEIEKKVIVAVQ